MSLRLRYTTHLPQPLFVFGALLVLLASTARSAAQTNPDGGRFATPTLDELAGTWQAAADLLSLPALNSLKGSSQAMRDLISVGKVSFPPITMTGETGGLQINGRVPELRRTRWYPYQVVRAGESGPLAIETTVRMPGESRGLFFKIEVTNRGAAPTTFQLGLALMANTSRHSSWGWGVPRDKEPDRFTAVVEDAGRSLLLLDSRHELENCYAFTRKPDRLVADGAQGYAKWGLNLKAGESAIIEYVLAFGEYGVQVRQIANGWADQFARQFTQVPRDWQQRFDAMFTPDNDFFSGYLPTLVTDDARMRRVYYMSAISLLSLCRTCFPIEPRVWVSNSPESNCTMMYFWDTREWATTLALLDPAMLKQYLRGWLARGLTKGYAEEYLTGTLKGPWYSANDYSVFVLLDDYLNVTGDRAFLKEPINGLTVLEHLDAIATHWKSLVRPGRTLADYGKASNLLECVPTYINEVASFNAANVWMMRRAAAIQDGVGNHARARELRAEARHLLPAVLSLYVPGEGVWESLHRDGTRVQIRHVFDYATIGLAISADLSPQVREEMTGFVQRELLVDHWMRAQSLSDVAASRSRRPDHGPMGAYCAWPAETMGAMCEFGQFDTALDFLHRCAAVTDEGPFSQSRALLTETKNSPVRIARGPQPYNASNGGGFAEVIIRGFFGYQPDLFSGNLVKVPGSRGFTGQLINTRFRERRYNLISDGNGISAIPTDTAARR